MLVKHSETIKEASKALQILPFIEKGLIDDMLEKGLVLREILSIVCNNKFVRVGAIRKERMLAALRTAIDIQTDNTLYVITPERLKVFKKVLGSQAEHLEVGYNHGPAVLSPCETYAVIEFFSKKPAGIYFKSFCLKVTLKDFIKVLQLS